MSRAPTSRPTAWKGLAQALVLYVFICVLAASLAGELLHGVMLGSMSFLVYRFVVVRELITRHHRRGVLRSKDERWEEALVAFRESFRFWDRKRWLDDARGLLLASTATYPFRVLALYNEAWVLYRLGRPEEAGGGARRRGAGGPQHGRRPPPAPRPGGASCTGPARVGG